MATTDSGTEQQPTQFVGVDHSRGPDLSVSAAGIWTRAGLKIVGTLPAAYRPHIYAGTIFAAHEKGEGPPLILTEQGFEPLALVPQRVFLDVSSDRVVVERS